MSQEYPQVYAVRHIDENIRSASQSGGAFTAISNWFLENYGIVYGCVLDEKFQVCHIRAEDMDTRDHMRGSKYVQSKMGDTFKNVKTDLCKSVHKFLHLGRFT